MLSLLFIDRTIGALNLDRLDPQVFQPVQQQVVAVAAELIATGSLPQLQPGLATAAPGQLHVMTQTPGLPDPTEQTDEIPNPSTGAGLGADDEPDTFEPEEAPE